MTTLRPVLRAAMAAAVLCTSLAACSGDDGGDSGQSAPQATSQPGTATIGPDDPEARAWIAPGEGRVTLAPDWFDSMTDAAQFIDRLYAAGAERVVIAAETIRTESDGFMRADAIRVQLPADPAARQRVIAVLEAEAKASGRKLAPDRGQPVHQLSWE